MRVCPLVTIGVADLLGDPIWVRRRRSPRGPDRTECGSVAARADEQVKVMGLRRRIAENRAAAKRAIPHFTYVDEIDVTKLFDMQLPDATYTPLPK